MKMTLSKIKLAQGLSVLASVTMGLALISMLIGPRMNELVGLYRVNHAFTTIVVINVVSVGLAGVLLGLGYWWRHRLGEKVRPWGRWLIIELILAWALYEGLWYYLGYRQPVGDTQIVLNALSELQQQGHWGYGYMYANPQNLFLMVILWGIRLLSTSYSVTMAIFLAVHLATLGLLYDTLKRFGVRPALAFMTVQVPLWSLQLAIHAVITYTDSLAFMLLILFLAVYQRFAKTANAKIRTHGLWLLGLSVVLWLGFQLKGTLLILVIAVCVYLVWYEPGWRKTLVLLPLLVLMVGNLGVKTAINASHIYPDDHYGQPNTHYLMMGLGGTLPAAKLGLAKQAAFLPGVYIYADQAYTWSLYLTKKESKAKIEAAHWRRIQQRWRALGSLNRKLRFYFAKMAVVWSSGDMKASFDLLLASQRKAHVRTFFMSKTIGSLTYILMTMTQALSYLGIIVYNVVRFRRPTAFGGLANLYVSGYFIFLLLWEANPRYAMGIIPMGIIMLGLAWQDYADLSATSQPWRFAQRKH